MWSIAGNTFSWNPIEDLRRLLEFHFMVNAFRAGTAVAVVAGVIGWFMVLRRQTFAGHTLSVVAFPGAAGATLAGVSALFGYFGFCVAAALAIALVPRAGAHGTGEESAVIGTVQAFALACGFLFVTLYGGLLGSVNSLLFGSFLGITDDQVLTLVVVGAVALVVVAAIARPLLFASLDPDVAAAHGVPVRVLAVVFLVVLGVAVAEASQITGALLVFALLVVPPATAQVLTARPLLGVGLSVAIGVLVTWLGLACSYFTDEPIGFFVTTFAFAAYLLAHAGRWFAARRRLTASVAVAAEPA